MNIGFIEVQVPLREAIGMNVVISSKALLHLDTSLMAVSHTNAVEGGHNHIH
jgi:hypothetical protein